ncbi:sigma-70 family RNA polymerase sigma factor [Micromonospora sp. NPDC049204]|uniref:RNA polymerase sigma factor n=1 Tax=unclassified Micromonospora TaxID=2617518 RepID=UPI00340EE9FF
MGSAESAWFERVFSEHYDLIVHYALRRTGTWEDAADAAAETLLVAWRRRDTAPAGDAVRAWLYGIARRVLANQARTGRRQERLIARLRAEPILVEQSADRTRDPVWEALRRLKPADRDILILTAVEGLSPTEVAVVLECSAVSARVRLHRARTRLAREMQLPVSGRQHQRTS